MKNLKDIIVERLHITKDTKTVHEDPEFYYTCTVNDLCIDDVKESDVMDAYNEEILGSKWYNLASPHGKNNKRNTLWYAAYCYLLDQGPKNRKDILAFLKPGSSTQYAEIFTAMRAFNIIKSGTGKERGLCLPQLPQDWKET